MAPKQKAVAAGSAPAAKKNKKKAAAEETEPFPFGDLPEGARHALIEQLVTLGKMDDAANVARDIAAVSQVSKELHAMRGDLYSRLEALLQPQEGDDPTPAWAGAPARLRHEKRFGMPAYATWAMCLPPERHEIEYVYYEEGLGLGGKGVPLRVFAEVQRLNTLGLATTKATEFYGVTEKDLADVPKKSVSIGPLGQMHLRRLPDVVAAARRRYVGAVGEQQLMAAIAARAARAAERFSHEKYMARRAKNDEVEAWAEEHTQYKALRESHAAAAPLFAQFLNAKKRRALRNDALVAWVQDRFGGDVAAACASPEVRGAGAAARSLASSMRALMKLRTGAGGSGAHPGGDDLDEQDLDI